MRSHRSDLTDMAKDPPEDPLIVAATPFADASAPATVDAGPMSPAEDLLVRASRLHGSERKIDSPP